LPLACQTVAISKPPAETDACPAPGSTAASGPPAKKPHHFRQIGYNAGTETGTNRPAPASSAALALPIQLYETHADMADSLKDLMSREIDEELRREQLLKLWDKYGTFILAGVVLLVVGVGGWKYYEGRMLQANQAASTQYLVALTEFNAKRSSDAQRTLEDLVPNAPPGYAVLARLRLAANNATEGNTLDAVAGYDRIARDESVDPILQDFARLQIAMLKFDTITFPELRNQLSPLANDRSPWRYSARELLGMGAAKAGFPDEARSHFQRLASDRQAPAGFAERARMMVALLDEAERAKAAPQAGAGGEDRPAAPPGKAGPAEGKAKAAPGTQGPGTPGPGAPAKSK
jgi:hypothetical protein